MAKSKHRKKHKVKLAQARTRVDHARNADKREKKKRQEAFVKMLEQMKEARLKQEGEQKAEAEK